MKQTIRILAPAKINLHLYIGSPDESGYHPILSDMLTITFYDELEITLHDTEGPYILDFSVKGYDIGPPGTSTCVRILSLVNEEAGLSGKWELCLKKEIPPGSGLGGGSSDAGALLLFLSMMRYVRASLTQLESWAQQVGKDIPFFLHGGLARVSGYGEKVQPFLPQDVPFPVIVLGKPTPSFSTAKMYRTLDQEKLWERTFPARLPSYLSPHNTFEPLLNERVSEVASLFTYIRTVLKLPCQWSGTGSAFWVGCLNMTDVRYVVEKLRSEGFWYRIATPLFRSRHMLWER